MAESEGCEKECPKEKLLAILDTKPPILKDFIQHAFLMAKLSKHLKKKSYCLH